MSDQPYLSQTLISGIISWIITLPGGFIAYFSIPDEHLKSKLFRIDQILWRLASKHAKSLGGTPKVRIEIEEFMPDEPQQELLEKNREKSLSMRRR